MEEKKLTDEEIVKALEEEYQCYQDCKNAQMWGDYFDEELLKQSADLIHRLLSEKAEYERKLADGELVSKEWHDEQVLHLQEENDRLNDMKFTQEHCDLYKENEWLKAELNNISQTLDKELTEHEEFTKKAKAEIERLTERKEFWENMHDKVCAQYENLEDKTEEYENAITMKQYRIAELQKQVDSLKIKACPNADYCGGRIQQAVKDTVKEILDEVSKHFGGKWLVELYKKYGLDWSVEVE